VTGNAASENGGGLYAPAGAAVNGGLFQDNLWRPMPRRRTTAAAARLYTLAPATIVDTQFNQQHA
jgi:hypothetical protein